MNFGELCTALAQGAMDGQENPLSVIVSSRLYEVQKYLTVWNYSYDPVILCINRRLWESLDPDEQQMFSDCAREAMTLQRQIVAAGEQTLLDSLRGFNMAVSVLSNYEIDSFRKQTEPVYRVWSVELGSDIVNRFRKAAGHGD
jgi:TRAP-type C4-dicarboxylate transport system substrate-binding protein